MKIFKTKNIVFAVLSPLILTILISLQSCENELAQKSISTQDDIVLLSSKLNRTWKEQLEFIKSNKLNILKSNDIELLDYFEEGNIKKDSVEKIITDFTNNDNYIAFCNAESEKINIMRISEALNTKSMKYQKISKNKQDVLFKEIIVEGLQIIKLKWRVGDKIINTNCLVSDEKGIVFDNILSNIWVVTEKKTARTDTVSTSRTKIQKAKRFKTNTSETIRPEPDPIITYIIDKTWTTYFNSSSLSGYTGTATINYGVQYESKVQSGQTLSKRILSPHNASASATLSNGGTAAAGITEGSHDSGHADFYYGFWWSVSGTVTMTFTSNSGYSFSSTVSFSGQEVHAGIKNVLLSDL